MLTQMLTLFTNFILNGCEGSQNHAEQRSFALLSMTGSAGSTDMSLQK